MPYARCAYCGYIALLTCSGQFMPHQPMLVQISAMGPACGYCGPLPPIYTCPFMHTQYLFLPGTSPMPQPGGGASYAPVVQAPPGTSEKGLNKAFTEILGKMAGEFGKSAATQLFGGSS